MKKETVGINTVGIDIGSITTKAALLSDGKVLGTVLSFTGYKAESAGMKIFRDLLEKLNIDSSSVHAIVSTGYGRNSISFANKAVTEIICHGAGAYFLNPDIKTVIDVGGQDSKALVIDSNGNVKDFAMNDKCAAGTGRFLEVMARALEVDLDDFGELSLKAGERSKISNICTVFAESEVISHVSTGESRESIIAGIHDSVAARVSSLVARIGMVKPVMMTGGVAKNIGVVNALEKKLGVKIEVHNSAQLNGAIGAAVIAAKLFQSGKLRD